MRKFSDRVVKEKSDGIASEAFHPDLRIHEKFEHAGLPPGIDRFT